MLTNVPLPGQDSIQRQYDLFARAEAEEGLSIAVLARRCPIPRDTLKGWKNGNTMPAWALGALGEAGVPDHLLSLILEPFGRHVGTDPDGEGDLDTAAEDADAVATEVRRARSHHSPGGVAIVPQERAIILPMLRKSAASSRRAVGAG